MLAAFLRRVGGWVGRLFGRPDLDADVSMTDEATGASQIQLEGSPEADEPLRESVRRSLVPRWLVTLRTQVFTGLAVTGLLLFSGLTALVTGGLTADLDLATTQAVQGSACRGSGR